MARTTTTSTLKDDIYAFVQGSPRADAPRIRLDPRYYTDALRPVVAGAPAVRAQSGSVRRNHNGPRHCAASSRTARGLQPVARAR